MAITVTFSEFNGVAETETTGVTDLVFAAIDASGARAHEYPIFAGDHSFVKYIKANFAGIVAETISVTKFYKSAGTLKTGDTLTLEGLGPVTYATPTSGTDETSSDSAIPTSLPATQNLALGGADDGTLVADGASDYMRLQRATTVVTPNGTLNDLILTLSYDAS